MSAWGQTQTDPRRCPFRFVPNSRPRIQPDQDDGFCSQTVALRGQLTVLIGRSHLERPVMERPFLFSIRPSG